MEELLENYKIISLNYRMILMAVVGLLYPTYQFFEEGSELDLTYQSLQDQKEVERQKYERAKEKRENLPQIEKELDFTESQIGEARKRFPDDFHIDNFLARSSTVAEDLDLEMNEFIPDEPGVVGTDYKYSEQQINISLQGDFDPIIRWLEQVIQFDHLVNFGAIKMEPIDPTPPKAIAEGDTQPIKLDIRSRLKVSAKLALKLFSSRTDFQDRSLDSGVDNVTVEQAKPADSVPPETTPGEMP